MSALGGLLGDYASDGDSQEGSEKSSGSEEAIDTAQERNADSKPAGQIELLSQLPAPKTSRKRVQFRVPVNLSLLSDDEDEEELQPRKKLKSQKKSSKLLDWLPAPKNDFVPRKKTEIPLFKESVREKSTKHKDSVAVEPEPESASLIYTNEAYRVDNWAPESNSEFPAPQEAIPNTHAMPKYCEALQKCNGPEDVLQMAFQEEQDRAWKKGQKGHAPESEITFKTINQKELTYVDPSQRESVDAIGTAFGSTYASELRGQARPFKGSKLAKRKHQIGTLFHDMKMRELEMMANKAQGMKSKHETEKKYGWR